MPQPKPSQAFKDMLVERDIALWQASHYTDRNSRNPGHPNSKDPVLVTLATPRAVDRFFYGRGASVDEAIANGLASNSGLNFDEPGMTGALARLENEMHGLSTAIWQNKIATFGDDLDDDVPF